MCLSCNMPCHHLKSFAKSYCFEFDHQNWFQIHKFRIKTEDLNHFKSKQYASSDISKVVVSTILPQWLIHLRDLTDGKWSSQYFSLTHYFFPSQVLVSFNWDPWELEYNLIVGLVPNNCKCTCWILKIFIFLSKFLWCQKVCNKTNNVYCLCPGTS